MKGIEPAEVQIGARGIKGPVGCKSKVTARQADNAEKSEPAEQC